MIVSSIIVFSVVPLSIIAFNIYESPLLMFMIMFLSAVINQIASILILHKIIKLISLKRYFSEIIVPALVLFFVSVLVIYFRHSVLYIQPFFSLFVDFAILLVCTMVLAIVFLNEVEKQFVFHLIKR